MFEAQSLSHNFRGEVYVKGKGLLETFWLVGTTTPIRGD
jgi:hypothetical protein